jgi:penicillin-binding protein 2
MRVLSERNRVRIKKIPAPRGTIYDRNGVVLADTRPAFNLYLIPEDIRDFSETVDGLSGLLGIPREEIMSRLKQARGFPPSFPVLIKSDISMDEVAKVEAHRIFLPGVTVQMEPKRFYPHGDRLAHVLGYVSEISPEELKMEHYKDYSAGDIIGKYGIERIYEKYLRGKDGEKRVEVDATGRETRILETREPVPGNDLFLNIDFDLQRAAEDALDGKAGAVVVLNPRNGEVLALASRPSFDPNSLVSGLTDRQWRELISDPRYPLQNRAIQGRYPPGSIFKLVLAMKALEDGLADESTSSFCGGGMRYGNRFFRCWKEKGHGRVNLHRAIVESCDTFFYQLGLRLGIDRIHEFAGKIGLTSKTGIDLPDEKPGFVPSTEWKLKRFHVPWFEGETLSVAIGQGPVWLTPLGLCQLAAFIANEGIVFRPRVVKKIVSREGRTILAFEPETLLDVRLKEKTAKFIKEATSGVVNERSGTAYASHLEDVEMCGKTGTAQVASLEKGKHLGDHAWFIAFAPRDDPAIAISVLVERGGHGASAAAPIAKLITQSFVNKNSKRFLARTQDSYAR